MQQQHNNNTTPSAPTVKTAAAENNTAGIINTGGYPGAQFDIASAVSRHCAIITEAANILVQTEGVKFADFSLNFARQNLACAMNSDTENPAKWVALMNKYHWQHAERKPETK